MASSSDIQQRLRALDARKKSREKIVEDLRAGKYDGIISGTEYFKQKAAAPSPQEKLRAVLPDLETREGTHGRTLIRTLILPRGATHPNGYANPHPLSGEDAHPIPARHLHHLSREIPAADAPAFTPSDVCFLDTETTGLMGGTGTVPFLTGVGWWEASADGWQFHLEQYLIEDFQHEGDMLERLVERLAGFRAICTYNGRTFDMPLLRARAILNRIPPSRFRHAQIDLLHFSRRLWKRRLGSVSLKNVEREVLCIDRGPDVDGALIPEIFFHFARTGRADRIPAVLDHNVQDIVTLGALLSRLGDVLADPLATNVLAHPEEFAAIARWCQSRGELDRAVTALERALERISDRDREDELLFHLALLHKRASAWPKALEILDHLSNRPINRSLPVWIELAKYHEHVGRDTARALALVRQCRRQWELEQELAALTGRSTDKDQAVTQALEKRESRLARRVAAAPRDRDG